MTCPSTTPHRRTTWERTTAEPLVLHRLNYPPSTNLLSFQFSYSGIIAPIFGWRVPSITQTWTYTMVALCAGLSLPFYVSKLAETASGQSNQKLPGRPMDTLSRYGWILSRWRISLCWDDFSHGQLYSSFVPMVRLKSGCIAVQNLVWYFLIHFKGYKFPAFSSVLLLLVVLLKHWSTTALDSHPHFFPFLFLKCISLFELQPNNIPLFFQRFQLFQDSKRKITVKYRTKDTWNDM